jgi:LmbE family N-acetylglucosaminyl deacetylase
MSAATGSATRFRFTRREQGASRRVDGLGAALASPGIAAESWLFVTPHEDLVCLSAGLLVQAALAQGVRVHVVVASDGAMGYCDEAQRDGIVATRAAETETAYRILGLGPEAVRWVGYPDTRLPAFRGRWRERPGERGIRGHMGLQNAFTFHLRELRPDRVFIPSSTDIHPDNRVTAEELMISLYHAVGPIWPELGSALAAVPMVHELATYCDFAAPPDLQVEADAESFERKLASLSAFASQVQFEQLVRNFRRSGPYEHLRDLRYRLYAPETYLPLFT